MNAAKVIILTVLLAATPAYAQSSTPVDKVREDAFRSLDKDGDRQLKPDRG